MTSQTAAQTDLEVRVLSAHELALISQVDRSEVVTADYVAMPSAEGLGLRLTRVPRDTPVRIGPWNETSVQA